MLRLFEGGFSSNMHDELIREISRSVASGRRVYLIVPEQQTVAAECEMSKLLPPSAPLSFEVTNFTRFTNTVFRAIGGISGEYSTPVAKSLTMWRTLTELAPMLTMTKGRPNIPSGTVDKAMAAVSEIQALGISPDELEKLASAGGYDRRLGEKLSDLSLVYSLYTGMLGEKYADSANDASVLADMLRDDHSFLTGTEIFVDGFTSFTETQYKLLGELMRHVPLTVTVTRDSRSEDSFEFKEVSKARARLIQLADTSATDKKLLPCRGAAPTVSPVIGEIGALLWRSEGEIDNDSLQMLEEDGGRVRIFVAPTSYEECNFVAEDIKRRVMCGDKYSDFAIIARRAEEYVGVLDFALLGADIPHFFSKPTDVTTTPAVKLILTAYRIVLGGFKREDVLTYLKCGLCGIPERERDLLEGYVYKWSIDGRRFTDETAWNMNPRGYTDMRPEDSEALILIDGTRRRLVDPLIAFGEDVKAAKTVREHAEALIKHLSALSLEDALIERAERLLALEETEAAEESAKAWGAICNALDAVVDILNDTPADAESFVNQLTVALSANSVGRIPAHRDEVTVGSADMLRTRDKKHVYMIGVNSGEFPSSVSDGAFFTDRDKSKLKELGLPIEPDLEVKSARELYSFSRAFSYATSSVTLLYAEKTAMLTPLQPSEVIERISEITKKAIKPIATQDVDPGATLYSPTLALEALGTLAGEELAAAENALKRAGYAEKLNIADGNVKNTALKLDPESTAMLYQGDLYLSQTKIDSFLSCPMSYFLKYNLRLDTGAHAELDANVIGSFVHGVIEGFFNEAKRLGRGVGELDDEERRRLTESCAEQYVQTLIGESKDDARTRVAISRLVRATRPVIDGLCDEFAASKYEPVFFELETSARQDDLPDHLILRGEDGGRIVIKAKIDRVDTYKNGDDVYVRVIDYKTGSNSFLPSKLGGGEYLQMFLYLRAVTESSSPAFNERLGVGKGGRAIPAGVIYVKTGINDATIKSGGDKEALEAVREMQKRDGMILSDPISVDAMNPNFLPPKPGPRSTTFESREYDEDGWREISGVIEGVVKDVASGMKSGRINATPATRSGKNCNWCKFKEICRGAIVKEGW